MTANVRNARLACGERARQKVVDAVIAGAVTHAELREAMYPMSLANIKYHLIRSGLRMKADRMMLAGRS